MTANRIAAKVAPIAMLFFPAELVVCCVGVALALMVPLDELVTAAKVVCAGVVATPAFPIVGTPVTRAAAPLEVPTVVKTT